MQPKESTFVRALRGQREENCSFRTVQTTQCHTEVDKNGKHHRKCQRVLKKFKECPGKPTETIEHVENSIDPTTQETLFSPQYIYQGAHLPTIEKRYCCRDGFKDVQSEMEAMFSKMDGMFREPAAGSLFGFSKKEKSFRQKLGDYFAWERNQGSESNMRSSTFSTHPAQLLKSLMIAGNNERPEWKQFESDFQEI